MLSRNTKVTWRRETLISRRRLITFHLLGMLSEWASAYNQIHSSMPASNGADLSLPEGRESNTRPEGSNERSRKEHGKTEESTEASARLLVAQIIWRSDAGVAASLLFVR